MTNKEISSRRLLSAFKGCLVGSAVGDALGREFEGGQQLEPDYESFSGRWTDDTHMMIGLAESLIENREFNGKHMAMTFIERYEEEPWRGYASGPPQVFKWIKSGVPWNEASKKLFGGAGSHGNGAAMRVAPVGLLYFDDPEQLRAVAYDSGQITHAHELGKEGAAIEAFAVALAVNLLGPSAIIKTDVHDFLDDLRRFTKSEVYANKLGKVEALLDEGTKTEIIREIGNGVEAHNSVPTAIYSFLRNLDNFREAVSYSISLGGDTDTIGAMTGAISGAYHGLEAIPQSWRSRLEQKDYIERLAESLWRIKKGELRRRSTSQP